MSQNPQNLGQASQIHEIKQHQPNTPAADTNYQHWSLV